MSHHEGIVERREDVRDAEHVLPLRHLGTEGNPLFHLRLGVLFRLGFAFERGGLKKMEGEIAAS